MLQILKCALPLVSSVSEAETWEKDGGQDAGAKGSVPVSAIVCGAAGIVCVIAGMLGAGLFALFRVLWSAAGCALLIAAGWLAGRGRKKKTGKGIKTINWERIVTQRPIRHPASSIRHQERGFWNQSAAAQIAASRHSMAGRTRATFLSSTP